MTSADQLEEENVAERPARALAGARGWVITDGKAGMQAQCVGVADALGLDYRCIRVTPRGLWRLLAPWGPPQPSDRVGREGSELGPPWPDIALATGRLSIPYLRAVRRLAGPEMFTVVLQDPRTGPKTADLIWVPEHDKLRAENVITTLTSAHAFTAQRLADLRTNLPAGIAALPQPRIAVLLGGPNAIYKYGQGAIDRFETALAAIAETEASFMITPSRRTPDALRSAADRATTSSPRVVWDGTGDNPYGAYLAAADALIVTSDSINMTSEACATGKPVFVFLADGGSDKFARFHSGLEAYGATSPFEPACADWLQEGLSGLASWRYVPLQSAAAIARQIERRWQARPR